MPRSTGSKRSTAAIPPSCARSSERCSRTPAPGKATSRGRAYYPAIRIRVETYDPIDTRLSYGHVAEPGIYQTTITQPALFRDYLIEQVGLLLQNHRVAVEVGESDSPIPHFAFPEGAYVEGEHLEALKRRCATCSTCPTWP